ncbi:MAG: zinc-dependent alcohol dehydrogenase family protein [Desulfobacteraceae bacterium]|jgi:alcohol dehydrogenase
MKAAVYEWFGQPLTIRNVPDPVPDEDGVVIEVKASGVCLSDWHGWMGHDPDIKRLPHVPGHELAGVVTEVGRNVSRCQGGDRVTLPFVCGCGTCPQCLSGNHQVCDRQFQPGFTHWGSFAQYVAVNYADINLVRLPEEIDYVSAASLGCRVVTSFRAVVAQGKVTGGEWVAVHGCGGVGLSAIMIADALGASTVGVDIRDEKLEFARSVGATAVINASKDQNVVEAVMDVTNGGAHVSIDALGSPTTCFNSISCLRKRGRHIQVGLMVADYSTPSIPMAKVIARELEILGSHGMQAHQYDRMLQMILSGKLQPERLIGQRISLEEAPRVLERMDRFATAGIHVIDRF